MKLQRFLILPLFAVTLLAAAPASADPGEGHFCTFDELRPPLALPVTSLLHIDGDRYSIIDNVDVGYTVFRVPFFGDAIEAEPASYDYTLIGDDGTSFGTATLFTGPHSGELMRHYHSETVALPLYCF